MNILVCTPGRMLQHLQESPEFDPDQLQMLVLDEADRILDLGFSKTLDAILDFLPNSRQTLLFSATQTKSVSALARLSLKDPKYVGVYQHSELSIPENLNHNYMVCDLPNKLNVLYSFIKTHLQSKAIVFVSACKQVRFIFETFCKLQPGVPLMQLHGRQKQFKRLEVYEKFTQSNNAFLFCTDIAARGLDFPAVDWVIQLDCPENAETYVHRVGRTARYNSSGNALMFLCPSEEKGMLAQLEKVKITVDKIEARSSQIKSIQPQLQSFCFQDPEIKYLGQRAFISYLKSIYVQKDKDTFDVHKLPAQEYSHSLGLPGAPNIKFSKKKKAVENVESEDEAEEVNGVADQEDSDDEGAENDDEPKTSASSQPKTKMEKLFAKKNTTILADHYNKLVDHENVADEEDDFITLKRGDHQLEGDSSSESDSELPTLDPSEMTKRQIQKAKKKALKERPMAERLIFDDEGEAHALYELEDGIEFQEKNDIKAIQSQYVQQEGEKLAQEDIEDKRVAKEKKKAKRLAQKLRAKGDDAEDDDDDGAVAMLPSDAEDESDSESDESSGSDSESSESETSDDDKIIVDYRRNNKRTLEEEEEEARKKANILEISEPQTLEEQEALALKLLQG
jgi:ATP-dependent RNA helicase DDX10/DBP4